jgi:CO/xanthine dehydrogenase Mo-binding subunit
MPMSIEPMHSEAGAHVFKGVGESGIMAAVPAIANAIADALADLSPEVSVNQLPLTASVVLDLVRGGPQC